MTVRELMQILVMAEEHDDPVYVKVGENLLPLEDIDDNESENWCFVIGEITE